jgi:hypothetical protein
VDLYQFLGEDYPRRLVNITQSGVFITRRTILEIGRRLGIGVPLGDRDRMIRELFERAAGFGVLDRALELLADYVAAVASRYPDAPWLQEWKDRAKTTEIFLREKAEEFRSLAQTARPSA